MKLNFLTFASTNMSKERITKEAKESGVFDNITSLTEKDLPCDFQQTLNKRIQQYGMRGYAYWSWKPYIINSTLAKMNDGDFLLYMDAGSHLNINERSLYTLHKCVEDMKTMPLQITGIKTSSDDLRYTTGKLVKYIGEYYGHTFTAEQLGNKQICAGTILIIKNDLSVKAINDFNSICNGKFELITDIYNHDPDNAKNFIDNRHDQSVWSLITKYYGVLPYKIGGYCKEWDMLQDYPIWHTRKKYN